MTLSSMINKKGQKGNLPKIDNIHINGIALAIFFVFMLIGIIGAALMDTKVADWIIGVFVAGLTFIGFIFLFSFKVAQQWEKAVVLRFGKFRQLKGPGAFWVLPLIDQTPTWIDHRVMVTPFSAEKTLTKDTVPVDVDAVLFWLVWDAEKAALEVEDYRAAISWASQTALREIIGQMTLADILVGRAKDGCRPAKDHRRTHHPLGHHGPIGGNPRRGHPPRSGRRHEPPGTGRTRTPGTCYSG